MVCALVLAMTEYREKPKQNIQGPSCYIITKASFVVPLIITMTEGNIPRVLPLTAFHITEYSEMGQFESANSVFIFQPYFVSHLRIKVSLSRKLISLRSKTILF